MPATQAFPLSQVVAADPGLSASPSFSLDEIAAANPSAMQTHTFSLDEIADANPPPTPADKMNESLYYAIENGRRAQRQIAESRSGVKGFVADNAEWVTERTPFIGGAAAAMDAAKALSAADRLHAGDYGGQDLDTVANFVVRNEKAAKAWEQSSTPGKAWSVISRLPGFAAEFAATGGGAQLIKGSVKKLVVGAADDIARAAAMKAVEGATRKSLLKASITKVGDLTSTAALQTAINVPRLAAGTMQNMGPQFDDEGRLVQGDSLARGATRSFAEGFIENLTEQMGGEAFHKAVGTFGKAILGPERAAALAQAATRLSGADKLMAVKNRVGKFLADKYGLAIPDAMKKLADQAAFNGALGEYMEERYGEGMRLAGNALGLDLVDPKDTIVGQVAGGAKAAWQGDSQSALEQFSKAIEQTAVEGLAFSVPGAAARAYGAAKRLFNARIGDRRAEGQVPGTAPVAMPWSQGADAEAAQQPFAAQPAPAAQFGAEPSQDVQRPYMAPEGIPSQPAQPIVSARLLRTAEGAAAFLQAQPEAVAAILANPSRRNIARLTGTRVEEWSDHRKREQFVAGLRPATTETAPLSSTGPLPPPSTVPASTPIPQPPTPGATVEVPAQAVAHGAPAAAPGVGATGRFVTSKGSSYDLHEDGTTTRTKSKHDGHDAKDVGVKQRSDATYYVSPDAAREIGMWQTSSAKGKRIAIEDGKAVLLSTKPKSMKVGVDGRLDLHDQPAVGLHPLEVWDKNERGWYRGNHPGSAITSIERTGHAAEASHPVAPPAPAPIAEDQPRMMGTRVVRQPATDETIDGQRFEVFLAKEGESAILRQTDVDSGKIVTLKKYPNADMARKEINKAREVSEARQEPEQNQSKTPSSSTATATTERTHVEKMRHDVSAYIGAPVTEAEADPAYQPAIDAAKKLGLNAHVVRMGNSHGGFSRGKDFLINANVIKGENAIWYIAGHEIAHGTGVDKSLQLTDDDVRKYGQRYLADIPQDSPYHAEVKGDPARLKREAAAEMIGTFMTDEGFRNELFAEDRGLWDRISSAIVKFFSGRKLSPTARAALDALKDARKRATINEATAAKQGESDVRRDDVPAPSLGTPVLGGGASGPRGESPATAASTPDLGDAGEVSDDASGAGRPSGGVAPKQPRPGRQRPDGTRDESDHHGGKSEPAAAEGTIAGDEDAVEAFQSNAGETSEPAAGTTADPNRVNHRIGADDVLLVAGPGAKKTRALANIKAIKLLKLLESEDRNATAEEKRILAQYVGWGGLKGYFARILGGAMDGKHSSYLRNEAWEKKYGPLYKEIRQLLTDAEWNAAASSTQNAHYTDRRVIERMWEIAGRLGFQGGKVWEPAAGVGHFFGLMPDAIAAKSKLIASEKDSLSARITAKLYPRAKVMESALENLSFPNNTVDLAISNVPFSAFKPSDAQARYGTPLNLHNYFLARMIDSVRPGGLVIAISTFRTMDSQNEMRKFLAGRANLVGAVRLPNTAFKENADTEIPTDIIILQKPLNAIEAPAEPFGGLYTVSTPDGPAQVNEYFARHPEMVLGTHSLQGTMYGGRKAKQQDAADEAAENQKDSEAAPDKEADKEFEGGEYTVMPKKGVPLDEQLAAAIGQLPQDVLDKGTAEAFNFSALGEAKGLRENAVQMVDGRVAVVKAGRYANPQDHGLLTAATELVRAKEYIELRDHYKSHLRSMLSSDATDAQIEASRKALDRLYEAYHNRNGILHGKSTKPLSFDPDFYLVRGMEKVKTEMVIDKKTGKPKQKYYATKADVLSKRTLYPTSLPVSAGSISEAVRLSSFYKGTLDIDYVAQLLGKSVADAEAELSETGEAFKDVSSGLWEAKATYLSGNVREKLAAAKRAVKDDKQFETNVTALEKAQPTPKTMANIRAGIASTWIPPKVHEQFLREKLTAAPGIMVQYNQAGDQWSIDGTKYLTSEAAKASFGTDRVDALTLYEQALNMRSPSVFDHWRDSDGEHTRFNPEKTQLARAKQTALQEQFATWLKNQKDLHPELERIFNEQYNSNVLPEYDSSDLPLPGASTTVKLRSHQMRVVRRYIGDGFGLMAHAVGSGKTFAMIATAMESKRLGLAKKPLIVVQNATLTQFAASFHQMYPAANVLIASKADLESKKRQAFLSMMNANEYDAVIMPQSSFDLLPVSEERQISYINSLIEELERAVAEEQVNDGKAGKKRRGKSDLESQLDKLKDRLKTLTDKISARAEKLLTFEDLGIDLLFIDEAHAYKKPPFYTKLERIVGLNKSTSQRAFQMLLKARSVQEKRNGKGVILATGTPITNTMGEAYHMLNICAPNVLKEYGVEKFDQFASTFFQIKQVLTTNAARRFTNKTALHGWMNQAIFRRMLRTAWDIITTTQLHDIFKNAGDQKVDLPKLEGGKTTIVAVPITKAVKGIKKFLGEVYDTYSALTGEAKKESSWVPLVTYGLSKAAALDIRLVYPQAADDPGSKVNACVARALAIFNDERYAKLKGTQLIFCDSFNPVKTAKLMEFIEGKEIDLDIDDREEVDSDEGVKLKKKGDKDDGGQTIDDSKVPFLYADLRRKLVAGGIPLDQIAIITEHDTDTKRAALFEKVKNGDVRILIGSTPKMGVGVNVQDRMSALHHLDAPWLPSDLEQRNGRLMRQGNLFALPEVDTPVQLLSYGMIDTLDAGLYASILRKAQNIEGALSSQSEDDLGGDEDPFSGSVPGYQEQMAILSGDMRIMEKLELTEKIKSWEMEREAFLDAKASQERTLENMQDRLDELTGPRIKKQKAIVKGLTDEAATPDSVVGAVGGKNYRSAAALGEAIDKAVKSKAEALFSLIKSGDIQQLDESGVKRSLNAPGGHKNLPKYTIASLTIGKAQVEVVGYAAARAKASDDGKGLTKEWSTGIATRMEYEGLNLYSGNAQTGRGLVDGYLAIADKSQQALTAMESEAAHLKKEIPAYGELLKETFSKTEDLANARTRIRTINDELAAEGAAEEAASKQRGAKKSGGAAEQAQEEADTETDTEEGMAAGLIGRRRIKDRPDIVPDVAKVDDSDVERRMAAAHGVGRSSTVERAKEALGTMVRKATRAQEFLPNTGEWGYENEWFRLLKEIPQAEQDETLRTVAAIVDPLGPKQRILFERKLMVDNLIAAVDRGEPLRFGFKSREQMAQYQTKVDTAITQTPEVVKALERRSKVVKELVADLVKYELIGEEAAEKAETYFHHQVLSKYDTDRAGAGGSKPNPVRRSFQRARVLGDELGEEYDVNNDFIQAESAWMQEARVELAKAKRLADLEAKRDIKPRLKVEARRQNFENLVGGPEVVARINELRRLIRESQESDDSDESSERGNRKQWIEELTQLDPTYPYRKRISMFANRIRKAWRNGKFTAPGFAKALNVQAGMEDATDVDDLAPGWFRFLAWAASARADSDEGVWSRGIFKAIQDRKAMMQKALGRDYAEWSDVVPETHDIWQPEPGNYFYEALAVPDKIAEQLQQGLAEKIELSPDELRQVLVMSGPKKQIVLRKELIEQLRTMEKPKTTNRALEYYRSALGWWKGIQMYKPTNYMANSVRNLLSDVEAGMGAAPGLRKHVSGKMLKELWDFYNLGSTVGADHAAKLALSPELRAARDLGVLKAGMQAQELPDINLLDSFARFYHNDASAAAKVLGALKKGHNAFQSFREATTRYAAFLYYREALKKGDFANFGGARPEVVRAIHREMGTDAAAAHLSRNLLGDYGNLTVLGNWLRSNILPFWSWNEINLKRTARLLLNARVEGKIKGKSAAKQQAMFTAAALIRYGWLVGAVGAWNMLFHSDEEEELGEYDRAKPHITLGRNADGTINIVRNISGVGDAMEWVGLSTFGSLMDNVSAGQMTWFEAMQEAAKDPLNKLVSSVGPQVKAPVELISGQSYFPDALNPRSVSREDALIQNLGIRDEYLAAKGTVAGSGDRAKPHYLQRVATPQSVVDPRENALHEIYDLRDRFLKREGKDVPSGDENVRNMRRAAAQNDLERFKEARAAYLRSGKSWKTFEASLNRLDPIAATMKGDAERKFANEYLTPIQRERLTVARDYARTMEVNMRAMWKQSATAGDTPEAVTAMHKEINHSLMNAADTLAEVRPFKRDKLDAWKDSGESAFRRLDTDGQSIQQLRSQYYRYLVANVQDPDSQSAKLNRFVSRLKALKAERAKGAR